MLNRGQIFEISVSDFKKINWYHSKIFYTLEHVYCYGIALTGNINIGESLGPKEISDIRWAEKISFIRILVEKGILSCSSQAYLPFNRLFFLYGQDPTCMTLNGVFNF